MPDCLFLSAERDKLILEVIWKCKRHQIAKTILKEKKVGGLTPSDFKTHSIATAIKTVIGSVQSHGVDARSYNKFLYTKHNNSLTDFLKLNFPI